MTSKYTPAPWRISGVGPKSRTIFRATDTSIYPVCDVTADNLNRYGSGDLDANAHLIVAAPELLEALEEMVRHDEVYTITKDGHLKDSRLYKARAAIAKARGEA